MPTWMQEITTSLSSTLMDRFPFGLMSEPKGESPVASPEVRAAAAEKKAALRDLNLAEEELIKQNALNYVPPPTLIEQVVQISHRVFSPDKSAKESESPALATVAEGSGDAETPPPAETNVAAPSEEPGFLQQISHRLFGSTEKGEMAVSETIAEEPRLFVARFEK